MKVLIFGPYTMGDSMPGGVERHMRSIVDCLSTFSDLELHAISISKEIKEDCISEKNGTIIHQIKASKLPMTIAGVTIYPLKMIREANRVGPDLIHGQMLGAPYGFATALLSRKYPTFLTVHTLVKQTAQTNKTIIGRMHDTLWILLEKWELKKIPNLILVSPYLKEKVSKSGATNVYVIPNGIDDCWFGIRDETIRGRILFVGRITPIKKIENLLTSLKLILDKGCNAHLHIVGPIDNMHYLKHLQELVKKLKLSEYVEFTGGLYGAALSKEYAESSVLVLPSLHESNPLVVLEAMASKKPVIATNVGGIPFMIENGKNGFIVEYGDSEGMVEKILMLINDNKIRDYLGENARRTAMNYLWDMVAEQTYELYKKVYEARRHAR